MRLINFATALDTELRDPEFAAAYLQDAMEEGLEAFLEAVGQFVRANGGREFILRRYTRRCTRLTAQRSSGLP